MKIGIIGTGIAGMSAAWLLSKQHNVTVYEKNAYIGGHSHTVNATHNSMKIPVDTGFIVYNNKNYPNLVELFRILGVETQKSNMSFSVSVAGGKLEYAGTNLNTVFGQRKNLINPRFWRMLSDIQRFNHHALAALEDHTHSTLGELLRDMKMSDEFKYHYLLPMGGAIWSSPATAMEDFPAASFIRFFHNHGLLTVSDQPQWYTVTGGSREYVKKITAPYAANIRLNCQALRVSRYADYVNVEDATGKSEHFDHVVIATHGDEALKMLRDPSADEKNVLGLFKYQNNRAVLHRDEKLMPLRKRVWSSWNYLARLDRFDNSDTSVTYWMNKLQNITPECPLFVTINPFREPEKKKIIREFIYEHPIFNQHTVGAQAKIPVIQGKRRTWYAGSYQRNGFHEDALVSAMQVASTLGVKAPWL